MTRTRLSQNRQPRRGFTLIELLVVISIIAVLASLIAPAVQTARRTARKLECLNNMRNVSIAMQNFAASTNGSLPTLTSDILNETGTATIYGVGWPVALLPMLDQTALLKNLKRGAPAGTAAASPTTFLQTDLTWTPVFTCPDDVDSFRRTGGLSFVVNSGYISSDAWGAAETNSTTTSAGATTYTGATYHNPYMINWNAAASPANTQYSVDGVTPLGTPATLDLEDLAIETATGVFFRPSAFQPSLEAISVGDGQASTVLITENLSAGPWNGSRDANTGYGTNQLGFGIRIPTASGTPTASLFTGVRSLQATNSWTDTSVMDDSWVINRNLKAAVGAAPRPSSNHMGGVNVMMADGHGIYISEQIDKITWGKLLTSDGVKYNEKTLDNNAY